jgi:hypothetical protein
VSFSSGSGLSSCNSDSELSISRVSLTSGPELSRFHGVLQLRFRVVILFGCPTIQNLGYPYPRISFNSGSGMSNSHDTLKLRLRTLFRIFHMCSILVRNSFHLDRVKVENIYVLLDQQRIVIVLFLDLKFSVSSRRESKNFT